MRSSICQFLLLLTLLSVFPSEAVAQKNPNAPLPEVVSFNAHIRPIMSNTCFVCHGPAGEENPSELRLDSFEAATEGVPSGEGQAITPGDAENSVVFQRIVSVDPEAQMPPPEFRHQLSNRDKALFRRWIEQGAKYQKHWAYSPLEVPQIPQVSELPQGSNEIDAFIVARLRNDGLEPSPQADRAALLRRLSLDLIGLPPTPEELRFFLLDDRDDAYERQVERLLASPHYGERMAVPWLDIVRFADTVGFHGDQNQRIFPYRDYVIEAYNKNKPFDEFTREQLAGDLLSGPDGNGPSNEQLTATGFTRLNMMTREGGAQPGEYLAKYTADRVRAVGTAWLGSTLGCCECHDHKYDPFSTKDFYSLGAFFGDLRQWGVYQNYGYTPNPDLQGFNNDSPFPPELYAKSESLDRQIEFLQRLSDKKIVAALSKETLESAGFGKWLTSARDFLSSHPDGWVVASPTSADTNKGTQAKQLDDASVLFTGKPQKEEQLVIELSIPTRVSVSSVRFDAIPDEMHDGNVGRAKNGSFRVEFEVAVQRKGADHPEPLEVAWAQPNHEAPRRYQSGRASVYLGKEWQSLPELWQVPSDGTKLLHTANYHLSEPLQLEVADRLVVRLKSSDVGRVKVSVTPFAEPVPERPAATERLIRSLAKEADKWEQDDIECLLAAYYRATTPADQVSQTCKIYRRAIVDCRAGYSHTLIAQQFPEERYIVSRVLPRGNWQDETGEIVNPAVPEFLSDKSVARSRRLTRLDLANWLVSDSNPLTSRHFVNRLWKQFFGAGLSNKLDDLGNQGEWPSHPLLLDWLACEFRDSGWDVKHTIKLIVMSNTYRQKASWRSDLSEIDPYNRLLSQQSARRLDAEVVRDNALAISGLLSDNLVGGPSVFPYQPAGYYANIQFPNRRYHNNIDDRQYRRGIYMHWQRTFLHPMLANFDAPARDECTADRLQSNSPQQALTLLNDPTFVEASRSMASKILVGADEERFSAILDKAFLLSLCREATVTERDSLRKLYERQREYFATHPTDAEQYQRNGMYRSENGIAAEELAAWAQICRVILNLHETITRY